MKGRKKENKIRNENENWKGENKKLKWRLDCRYSIRHRDVIVCQKLFFARSYSLSEVIVCQKLLFARSSCLPEVLVCQKLLFARSYSVANQFISNTSLATYSTQNILLAAMYL